VRSIGCFGYCKWLDRVRYNLLLRAIAHDSDSGVSYVSFGGHPPLRSQRAYCRLAHCMLLVGTFGEDCLAHGRITAYQTGQRATLGECVRALPDTNRCTDFIVTRQWLMTIGSMARCVGI